LNPEDLRWMEHAIGLSRAASVRGGSPFGSVLVVGHLHFDGQNSTDTKTDIDHAETNALRAALQWRHSRTWAEAPTLYSSCAPCPMCLSATYYAGVKRVVYGTSIADVSALGSGDPPLEPEILNSVGRFEMEIHGRVLRDRALAVVSEAHAMRGHL
jgi:guanine deaminase